MSWAAGEEKGCWSAEIEREAYRISRATMRNMDITWDGTKYVVTYQSVNPEARVTPDGVVHRISSKCQYPCGKNW